MNTMRKKTVTIQAINNRPGAYVCTVSKKGAIQKFTVIQPNVLIALGIEPTEAEVLQLAKSIN